MLNMMYFFGSLHRDDYGIFLICRLFHRLMLEAPAITDNAIQILKKYCMDTVNDDKASAIPVFIGDEKNTCLYFLLTKFLLP